MATMSHRYSRRNDFSRHTNFSRHSNFSRPLQHIHRRHIPVADELCHLSSTIRSSYNTSYQADFEGKDFSKVYPKRLSPPRGNLSHLVNRVPRVKTTDVICNAKTDKECQTSKVLGVPLDASMVGLETCKKNTFEKRASLIRNTRYEKNKSKAFPAIGIVPGENFKQMEDHWLPGSLALSTRMTVTDPYQYLPRKRKQINFDKTAAGRCNHIQSDYHRFHTGSQKRRGVTPVMTIRSSF